MKRRDKYLPLDDNDEFLTGPALYEVARRFGGDTLLLAFSRGKDSIAAWLELRDYFKIIPYYGYMVPGGLSFERESLDYYEQFFGQHIYRFPHPLCWHYINDCVHQSPQRVRVIDGLDVPTYEYADLVRELAEFVGLDNPYVIFGYRSSDDARRRRLMLREGPLGSDNYRYFWPIWDWSTERVAAKLKEADIALPLDYALWGRTITAYDYQYLAAIRDNLPEDWETFKFWFPLIEAEMFRHEVVNATYRTGTEG